jgi:hypothetical protein
MMRFRIGATAVAALAMVPLACAPLAAQAVFEDADGRTSIRTNFGALLGINTADESVEIGYYRLLSNERLFWGAVLESKSEDGEAPIFGGGDLSPGVSAEGTVGLKFSGQANVAVHYRRAWSQAHLVAESPDAANPVSKVRFFGWEAGLHFFNAPSPSMAYGIAVGRRRVDNVEDLPKVTVRLVDTPSAPGDPRQVEVVRTVEARQGSLTREAATFIDADVILAPFNVPVSVRPFGRFYADRADGTGLRSAVGVDLALYKEGGDVILDRRVGLVLQLDEERDEDEDDDDIEDRLTISVIANLAPVFGKLLDLVQ